MPPGCDILMARDDDGPRRSRLARLEAAADQDRYGAATGTDGPIPLRPTLRRPADDAGPTKPFLAN